MSAAIFEPHERSRPTRAGTNLTADEVAEIHKTAKENNVSVQSVVRFWIRAGMKSGVQFSRPDSSPQP